MSGRSTLQIIIAVQENAPATDEELRLALVALSSIGHFIERELRACLDAIKAEKPQAVLQLRATLAREVIERMFEARRKPPAEWLGPDNLPSSPVYQARLRAHLPRRRRGEGGG